MLKAFTETDDKEPVMSVMVSWWQSGEESEDFVRFFLFKDGLGVREEGLLISDATGIRETVISRRWMKREDLAALTYPLLVIEGKIPTTNNTITVST